MNGYRIDLSGSIFERFIKDDLLYLSEAPKDKSAYAIGVGCFKKECVVIAEKVW